MFGFDVMYIHSSQSEMRAELLLPIQHVVCYLDEIPVKFIVPVQQEVRVGTGREGGHVRYMVRQT